MGEIISSKKVGSYGPLMRFLPFIANNMQDIHLR